VAAESEPAMSVEGQPVPEMASPESERPRAEAEPEPFIMVGSETATEIAFACISVLVGLLGLFVLALPMYTKRYGASEFFKTRFAVLYKLSFNKWYIDELYHYLIVIPGTAVAYSCWRFFDLKIVDGIVNGTAWVLGAFGQALRPLQTGFVRNYALYLLLGVVIFMLINLLK